MRGIPAVQSTVKLGREYVKLAASTAAVSKPRTQVHCLQYLGLRSENREERLHSSSRWGPDSGPSRPCRPAATGQCSPGRSQGLLHAGRYPVVTLLPTGNIMIIACSNGPV